MTINVHDAEPQREFGELIPDGTFVRVIMHINPGGADFPSGDPAQDALDAGLFKQSTSSDVIGLDMDISVIWPEHYAGRKVFAGAFWTIAGGKLDSKGISRGWGQTKSSIRAAINSCMQLDPADKSAKASHMHSLNGFKDLDGLEFFARLSVAPGEPYIDKTTGEQREGPDKNGLYHIVEPGEPEYALLLQRQEVPPQPVNLKPRGRPATGAASALGAAAAPAGWGAGSTPGQARTWGTASPPAAAPTATNAPANTTLGQAVAAAEANWPASNGAAAPAIATAPAAPVAPAGGAQRPRWAGGA
jgi:hypothetical protein